MKIVIISGTMFPHISARSFRTTELAKGLSKLGHNVILYTILGKYDYSDLQEQYPNLTIKSLGESYWGNYNSDGVITHRNIFTRVLRRLLYNVIDFPRCEYFFKTLSVLKQEGNFDYLITIAHPYGTHWGAAYFKYTHNKSLNFKYWVSDCGDPFMGDPDVKRWNLFLKPIEKFWGRMTDRIVIPVENGISAYYSEVRDKISIIPQSVDFDSFELLSYKKNRIPTFFYSGAVYPNMRDPRKFLEYLSSIDTNFKFIAYLPSDAVFGEFRDILGEKLEIRKYIPRHELVKEMSSMDFLININNNSNVQTPSKLIDYSISKRPIINISTSFTEDERINFESFLKGDYSSQYIVDDIEQYDSKNVCSKFLMLYDEGTK